MRSKEEDAFIFNDPVQFFYPWYLLACMDMGKNGKAIDQVKKLIRIHKGREAVCGAESNPVAGCFVPFDQCFVGVAGIQDAVRPKRWDMPNDPACTAAPVQYYGPGYGEIRFCPAKDLCSGQCTIFNEFPVVRLVGFEQVYIVGQQDCGECFPESFILFPVFSQCGAEQLAVQPARQLKPV